MTTQIIEEWLTIPEAAEFFEVSQRQVRRVVKKLILSGDPNAKQYKIEGHFGTPGGKIFNSYVLLIKSKKCYQLWQEKPNLLELVRQLEKDKGKKIKVATQTEEVTTPMTTPLTTPTIPEMTTPIQEMTTPENKLLVDKDFLEMLKEDRVEKKEWIKKYDGLFVDYKAKDKELVEREKFLQSLIDKVINDAKNTKQMLKGQINYLQKQLHPPTEEKVGPETYQEAEVKESTSGGEEK
jgi:hypothetical protein